MGLAATCAYASASYEQLIAKGTAELKSGDQDGARRDAQAAVRQDGAQWKGYALLGGALMNLKRYEDAADAFSRAIERAPAEKAGELRELRRRCLTSEESGTASSRPHPDVPAPVSQAEVVLWKSIENSNNGDDFRSYLRQYPEGAFARLAQDRLDAIVPREPEIWFEEGQKHHVDADFTTAHALYQRACDRDYADACEWLGGDYRIGRGVMIDAARAQQLFQKAAQLYQQGCDSGDLSKCADLSNLYRKGLGVAVDSARAVELAQKSCEGKDATGCLYLGIYYLKGEGLPVDINHAMELYKQSCDGGNGSACTNLGEMYFGKLYGVPKDVDQGFYFFRKGCDSGNALGCNELGFMFEKGAGRPADNSMALELYKRACERGNGIGCSNAGILYNAGKGAPSDPVQAARYKQKGCALGYAPSCS